jgi:MarR family transcriptional regulator, organic hydroperoxide resistance regulator
MRGIPRIIRPGRPSRQCDTPPRTRSCPPETHRVSKRATARESHIARTLTSVRRIVRALRVAEQRTHADVGVSAAQLYVLRQLDRSAAGSLSELAQRTLTDRSSVADVVERLEARRLVRRTRGADRRRTGIVITAAGRMLLRRAPIGPTALLVSALAALDDRTLAAIADGLDELTETMRVAEEPASSLFEDRSARERAPQIRRRRTP